MDVQVTTEDVGVRTVLHVSGEIDVASADRLRERTTLLVAQGRTDLVVDLTGVTFLDSTGLGLLVGTLKRVRTLGGDLVLVVDSERLLKVFRITGLTQVFDIRETVADALGS
ncbi:STAS domain-containing protein [Cellulomonas sp. S1-8]|uniref:STAS domain-containing protein n=1 Tax=Cellulomonas sp. S1-8 TaxID=2904790 RepID=UPI0022444010|nr:STAS domain-containing protein [Cellulomonas sp. S1-8]UZN02424.1 STAS domain-containing protein [Cellulomonas sp. S1-8]